MGYRWQYLKTDIPKTLAFSKIAFAVGLSDGNNIFTSTLPNITSTGNGSPNDAEHGWPFDNRIYLGGSEGVGGIWICDHSVSMYHPNIDVSSEIGDGKTWRAGNISPVRYFCQEFPSTVQTLLENNMIAVYVNIPFEPSKSYFNFYASGGSQDFTIYSESNWTATTESDWVTLSDMTGGTGTTSLSVSVPNYTGTTRRTATITFTNNDGDTFNITINQRPPQTGGSSNLFMGEENITSIYFGEEELSLIYMGENETYVKGAMRGLKIKSSVTFPKAGGTKNIRIASESDWEILTDTAATWITSISPSTGTSGRSQIAITCEANTGETQLTTTITARTTDLQYSATCNVVLDIWPNNVVQYTSPVIIQPRNNTKFYDANGNQLTYTQTINDGVVTMTFSGDLARVYESWFYNGYGSTMTDITFPASLTAITNGITFYGQGQGLQEFKGYSPLICDNGNLVYETTANTTIVSSVKDLVGGHIVVPEGVTNIQSYGFWCCKCSSISFPSTIANIESCCFEGAQFSDMYIYAVTPPSVNTSYVGTWYYAPTGVTLHVPIGSNYSSFYKPSSWTLVYDL